MRDRNKIDIAVERVNGLCDGRLRWKMSIPVNFTEDSDIIICGALHDAKKHIEAEDSKRCKTCLWWNINEDCMSPYNQGGYVKGVELKASEVGAGWPEFGCLHW